ncbi:thioesterase family protein [Xanthobacter dioxanivorans]|uniref:Thioesterase family protein n=1 Tax=Xanthobacter dioxanivorans TaxID=2528964 RepID=A0A974SI77_9HYPH|nr:thioesterase family protein [Xanthobacter dioxanivorans]QRG07091.1 thioesterase family protein [Xanthobacter dioxanivorans]
MSAPECVVSHAVVEPHWIDFNGHMNYAHYVGAFDAASDVLIAALGLGPSYRERTHRTMYVVEAHLTYDREVKEADPLEIHSFLAGADDKRLHLYMRMYHATTRALVATNELLCLHVDQSGPSVRAVVFTPQQVAVIAAMAAAHAPAVRDFPLGKGIGLKGRRRGDADA